MVWFRNPSRVLLLVMMGLGLLACHKCTAYEYVNFEPDKVDCVDYFMDVVGTNDVQAINLCRDGFDVQCMAENWEATGGNIDLTQRRCDPSLAPVTALSSSPGANCSVFRLTSPLDGLANGPVTFYWDALPGATGYRLTVYDGGNSLGVFTTDGGQTSMTVDVSSAALGGGFSLGVNLEAMVGFAAACADSHVILRAAPSGDSNVSTPAPGSVCGNNICEPGEGGGVCCADCADNACIR
ncbi:MAG: hypothetical protein U0452_05805 [Anaerolineae bacterium]